MDWPFKELKSGAKDILKYQVSQDSETKQADLNKSRNSETEKTIYIYQNHIVFLIHVCAMLQ